jgi:hypothetical protein
VGYNRLSPYFSFSGIKLEDSHAKPLSQKIAESSYIARGIVGNQSDLHLTQWYTFYNFPNAKQGINNHYILPKDDAF